MIGKKVIIKRTSDDSEYEVEVLDKLTETYSFHKEDWRACAIKGYNPTDPENIEYGQRTVYLVCDPNGMTFNILPDRIIRIVI